MTNKDLLLLLFSLSSHHPGRAGKHLHSSYKPLGKAQKLLEIPQQPCSRPASQHSSVFKQEGAPAAWGRW